MSKQQYVILGGVNGAGKSTYRNLLDIKNGKVIDVDIIAKTIKKLYPDVNYDKANQKAGRRGIELFKKYILKKENIIQESTLSGKSFFNNIDEAKMHGYETHLVFIGLKSPELSINNISERVKNGGHDIPKEVVLRRFQKVYKNLEEAAKKVDKLTIVDNTDKNYEMVLYLRNGKIEYVNDNMSSWIEECIKNVIENSQSFYGNEKFIKISKKELEKVVSKGIKVKKSKFSNDDQKKFIIKVKAEEVKFIQEVLNTLRGVER